MTRAEAYAEGFHTGRRWAETDIRDGLRLDPEFLREDTELARSWTLGVRRGYRDTWNRWDAGEISWETFEKAPEGPLRASR